jgi:hypothetical protein
MPGSMGSIDQQDRGPTDYSNMLRVYSLPIPYRETMFSYLPTECMHEMHPAN